MSAAAPSPPTELMPRFALLIEWMKRGLGQGIDRRQAFGGMSRETLWALGTLALPLWRYLAGTLRRLAALHARFRAGTLAAAPRRRRTPRRDADRPRPERRAPLIPPGPVFVQYRWGISPTAAAAAGRSRDARAAGGRAAGRADLAAAVAQADHREAARGAAPAARPRRAKRVHVARPDFSGGNPSPQPSPLRRGEGEPARPGWWTYPVSLWPDPPAAKPAGPEPPLPDGLPSFCNG